MNLRHLITFLFNSAGCFSALIFTLPPPGPTETTRIPQVRDAITTLSTCGFLNGDASKPWVAPAGFNCRVDTLHGIWGFCPTTVISPTDCGLGAFCFDDGPCKTGCGRESLRNNPKVTTWTWYVLWQVSSLGTTCLHATLQSRSRR